jgi:hypothetical protein
MIKFFTLVFIFIIGIGYLKADDLAIKLVYPTPHAQVEECRDLPFIAEVTQQDTIPIYRVRFFRNGASFGTVRNAPWERTWTNVWPGYFEIFAEVQDDSGNVAYSDTTWINVGKITTPNLVGNGTFSCGRSSPWNPHTNEGAQAEFEVLDDSWLGDGGIFLATIFPESPGSETWHVQVDQIVPIDSGHTYVLTFKADVSDPRSIDIVYQENGQDVNGDANNYTVWNQQSVSINETGEFGPLTYECNITDHNNALRFNIGVTPGDLYLDDIVLTDASILAVPEHDILSEPLQATQYIISSNYPNPFNSTTTIQYQLPEKSLVSLSIYTITGQTISSFTPGSQRAGEHMLSWNGKDRHGRDVPSGIYIYRIDAHTSQDHYSVSRKIVLIK